MYNQQILTKDQIRNIAPSVFADGRYSQTTSDKYVFVSSADAIDAMESIGFYPVSVIEARVNAKNEKKQGYQKHSISFAPKGSNIIQVGDSEVRIKLTNSSDGLQSFMLDAEIHRKVCNNGLIVADSIIESVRTKHIGDRVIKDITEGTERIIDQVPLITSVVSDWSRLELNEQERNAFARAALSLKYDDIDECPIDPIKLTRPRRFDDKGNDLWTAFNKSQEHLIKGGLTGFNKKTGRRITTKAVKSIDTDRKLNKALFEVAQFFAAQKMEIAA